MQRKERADHVRPPTPVNASSELGEVKDSIPCWKNWVDKWGLQCMNEGVYWRCPHLNKARFSIPSSDILDTNPIGRGMMPETNILYRAAVLQRVNQTMEPHMTINPTDSVLAVSTVSKPLSNPRNHARPSSVASTFWPHWKLRSGGSVTAHFLLWLNGGRGSEDIALATVANRLDWWEQGWSSGSISNFGFIFLSLYSRVWIRSCKNILITQHLINAHPYGSFIKFWHDPRRTHASPGLKRVRGNR